MTTVHFCYIDIGGRHFQIPLQPADLNHFVFTTHFIGRDCEQVSWAELFSMDEEFELLNSTKDCETSERKDVPL